MIKEMEDAISKILPGNKKISIYCDFSFVDHPNFSGEVGILLFFIRPLSAFLSLYAFFDTSRIDSFEFTPLRV